VYDLREDSKLKGDNFERAQLRFDYEKGVAYIEMPNIKNFNGFFAHEMKHAYQFETGNMSTWGKGGGFLYDLNDEIEGYARGHMFNAGGSPYDDKYRDLKPGPISVFNYFGTKDQLKNPWHLQGQVNIFSGRGGAAFRHNGTTYYSQP
jgi:hypothetical protein